MGGRRKSEVESWYGCRKEKERDSETDVGKHTGRRTGVPRQRDQVTTTESQVPRYLNMTYLFSRVSTGYIKINKHTNKI